MPLTHAETEYAIEFQLPEIEINQRWVIYKGDEIYKQSRILARHPDGGIIVQEEPTKYQRINLRMGTIPEYNLRRIYRLLK